MLHRRASRVEKPAFPALTSVYHLAARVMKEQQQQKWPTERLRECRRRRAVADQHRLG
jgi:hypothetical protein